MSFIFWKFHDFRQRGPPFLLASLRSQRFLRLLIQFPPLFMVLISGCCWIIWIWMSFWDSGCTLYDMQELQQSHEYSSTYHQSQASNHGGWFVSIGCKELSDKITIAPTKQNKTKKKVTHPVVDPFSNKIIEHNFHYYNSLWTYTIDLLDCTWCFLSELVVLKYGIHPKKLWMVFFRMENTFCEGID